MDELFEQLQRYNYWGGRTFDIGFKRTSYLTKIEKYLGNRLVKVLTGQRRSGKSFILRQLIDFLINEKNIPEKNIFYFNKEFIGFETVKNSSDLNRLFDFYKQKLAPEGKIYIFIDEIQNIEHWELFVNSYSQDFSADFEIFITGSNSQMLSGELASHLSGRYVVIQIFPLSYLEFIDFYQLLPEKSSYLRYLRTGGLPELIYFGEGEVARNYVESLKNTIILRDIIQRYGIKDVALLENLFRFLANNIGNLTSFMNIVNYFKNLSKKTSYDTLATYTKSLSESFVFHEVERYDIRGMHTLGGVRKYFLNDLSFRNYIFGFTPTMANTNLENLVYLELIRQGYNVTVGVLNQTEVDFVAQTGEETLYFQVAYLLNTEKTIAREFENLHQIHDNFPKYVITIDDFKFSDDKGVKHVQAWELFSVFNAK